MNYVLNDTNISNIKTEVKWFNVGLKDSAKLSQDTLNKKFNFYTNLLQNQKSEMINFLNNLNKSKFFSKLLTLIVIK